MILEKIKKPNDIHKIPLEDFEPLAAEIRDFFNPVSKSDRRTSCFKSGSSGTDSGSS